MFMVALKDPAAFEKLIVRPLTRSGTSTARFTRASYRGVAVNASKSFAWAIVNGFFVAGGSVAQIRRAIDAQATGVSLASSDAFKSAFGSGNPRRFKIRRACIGERVVREPFEGCSKVEWLARSRQAKCILVCRSLFN